MTGRSLARVAMTALVSATLIGCAAASDGHGPKQNVAPNSAGARPTETSNPRAPELPLDSYLLTGHQQIKVTAARWELIDTCLQRFDLDIGPYRRPSDPVRDARRYGPTSPRVVAKYGYHPPPTPDAANSSSPSSVDQRTRAIVLGDQRTFRGMRVPSGGCAGQADRHLAGAIPTPSDPYLVQRLSLQTMHASEQDPRVQAVFDAWKECMAAHGYNKYDDPWGPVNDPTFDTRHPSQKEVATATIDVRCRANVDLVSTWASIEAGYQSAAIDDNTKQLAHLRRWNNARLHAACTLLSSTEHRIPTVARTGDSHARQQWPVAADGGCSTPPARSKRSHALRRPGP